MPRVKTLPPPARITEVWPIRSAYNAVRAVLTRRTDINHYYTGLEVIDNEVGSWDGVKGSAEPHTENRAQAEERILRLVNGDWKKYVNPETTKPKKRGLPSERSRRLLSST